MTESRTPNKGRLRLWVEDLENGGHRQVQDVMARQSSNGSIGYCCLGRKCEVAIANGANVIRSIGDTGQVIYYDGRSGSRIPESVAEWFGVEIGQLTQYATMNDRGKTFQEIAAAVRRDFDL